MITPDKAQQDYQAAMGALRQAALTPGLSTAERTAVRDAMRELTLRFLDQVELEVSALTAQYKTFINSMTALLLELQGGKTPVSVLNDLSGIVNTGAAVMEAVSEVTGAAREFRGGRGRAAARTKTVTGGGDVIRILCVHGVGHQENDPDFQSSWREAITDGLSHWSQERVFEIQFVEYDELFAADTPDAFDIAKALVKLSASGIFHGIGDLLHRQRGFGEVTEAMRWTAGMVVQWAEDEKLRNASRKRVIDRVQAFDPQVILAHSLGSLLTYDAFARADGAKLIADRILVTLGSQIGNPFVRSTLGGRIVPLDGARQWYHLFNPHDDAFTAALRIPAPNFEQVDAAFDIEGILDHDACTYLRHPNVVNIVWRAIALPSAARAATRGLSESSVVLTKQAVKARPAKLTKPQRRALLVGINDYPNPADRLEGCVNDVFLVSSLLQESGFDAENIRVVLNERATAAAIVERLEWLLDGAEDEQDRVFFYSGHGAQIPGYGVGEKVDRKDECLVPYDFNWTREHAVTDDQFYELYSQLPYGTHFLTILDCCHSGGMTRDGAAKARGLTPPDDIRHRELQWNAKEQMWMPRDLSDVKDNVEERSKRPGMFGERGDVNRLGRSAQIRPSRQRFDRACKEYGHKGPFMPIIFQACEEKQLSYEYRHGVQSYGAFTYSLGLVLRQNASKKLTWSQLITQVGAKLAALRYQQKPCLICPTSLQNEPIPWPTK